MVWEQRVGVIVVLTCEGEVGVWWPEEGEGQSHALVVGREWVTGECLQVYMRTIKRLVYKYDAGAYVASQRQVTLA